MSIPQYRTLVLLDAQPTASLSFVAENIGASLPTASRIVSGLVAKGLICRNTCESDRRQCSLRLTATGRAALAAGRRSSQELLAAELGGLEDGDRQTVIDAMRILGGIFGHSSVMPDAEAG